MVILILAEPRTGSSNLTTWFSMNKDFTTLFLPSNINSKWYTKEFPYKYKTKHLLIKEDFHSGLDFENLFKISEKVIYLYRENEELQIESWLHAQKTKNWHGFWTNKEIYYDEEGKNSFQNLKKEFKKFYEKRNGFIISYEELYYRNGISKLIEYVDIPELKELTFPIGKKYRIEIKNEFTSNHLI